LLNGSKLCYKDHAHLANNGLEFSSNFEALRYVPTQTTTTGSFLENPSPISFARWPKVNGGDAANFQSSDRISLLNSNFVGRNFVEMNSKNHSNPYSSLQSWKTIYAPTSENIHSLTKFEKSILHDVDSAKSVYPKEGQFGKLGMPKLNGGSLPRGSSVYPPLEHWYNSVTEKNKFNAELGKSTLKPTKETAFQGKDVGNAVGRAKNDAGVGLRIYNSIERSKRGPEEPAHDASFDTIARRGLLPSWAEGGKMTVREATLKREALSNTGSLLRTRLDWYDKDL